MVEPDKDIATGSEDRAKFRPSAFMRLRRPEQFSDSYQSEAVSLDKSFFEYHLDTITNRSDEKSFEHFCRKLAQKEICPNLIPQTGPTGGGDSKVDTETYPVSEEISERWYEGSPKAASERWAFAISAKKDWKSKVQTDVKKISETERSYSLIYFMSNQFIKDKDRAAFEDKLSRKHGIRVKIIDRSWLVEKVFDSDHTELAIETLNISVQAARPRKRSGPLDTEREAELAELEAAIKNQDGYRGVEYQLAEDCLRAAILARELERSRVEVDGRFDRAERIANNVGHAQQQLRIKYQRAWTACYWFDDFGVANHLYDDIESLASASNQAVDLELLSTVCQLIASGVRYGYLTVDNTQLDERTTRLKGYLKNLIEQIHRPNNAAHAKAVLCTMQLTEDFFDEVTIGEAIQQMAKIFGEAEHLGGYPFDKYAEIFKEMGDFYGEHPAYDKAFEVLLPILERRRSEGETGLALLKRGLQKLEKGSRYDAIRLLGRAQQKLIKYEYRSDLVFCLTACARAYEMAGLPWAAHTNLLAAASLSLSEFSEKGKIIGPALYSIQRLIWTELQVGRVPHVLAYIQFADLLGAHLQMDEEDNDRFLEQRQTQDGVLAMLLLRSSISQLKSMEALPKTLEKNELIISCMALLFALGHEEGLITEGYIPEGTAQREIFETFEELSKQPARDDIPPTPELFDQDFSFLKSSALGCQWIVKVENCEASIRIGEAFLGFIESFFATSLNTDAIPHRQQIDICVRISAEEATLDQEDEPQILLDDPSFVVVIEHSENYDPTSKPKDGKLQDLLRKTLAILIPRILYVPDLEKYFDRIVKNEEGFGRSLTFSDIFTSASNVVGSSPIFDLSEWYDDERSFPLKRIQPVTFESPYEDEETITPSFGVGEPPEELRDTKKLRHGERRVFSLINKELWDAAKWCGMAVVIYRSYPPILSLLFTNEEPARQIFLNWQQQFGTKDEDDIIRISIVTGVDKENPFSYSFMVGTNIEKVFKDKKPFDQAIIISRIHRMVPQDSKNLDLLLSEFNAAGCYFLAPAIMSTGAGQPHILSDLGIMKRELGLRPAWQIGENDPDSLAISLDDDPIIPEGVANPPVNRLLERRRNRGR